jgi:hypothetical protein
MAYKKWLPVLLFFCMPCLLAPSQAADTPTQDVPAYTAFQKALGFSGGRLSGIGVSYRQWFARNGVQAVFGIYYIPDVLDYWVSFEYLRQLLVAEYAPWIFNGLYLFFGASHRGHMSRMEVYTPEVGIGGGFGIELGLLQHFSFTLELGYGLFFNLAKSVFWEMLSILPIVQGSFHYRY